MSSASVIWPGQAEQIVRWLSLFVQPGQWTELRGLSVGKSKARSAFYAAENLQDLAKQALAWEAEGATGCYFVPNPLRADVASSKKAAADADVIARHWLLIDVDPVRFGPDGRKLSDQKCPTTDNERQAAWRVLDRCLGSLEAFGFREPIIAASGNGFHLCYRVDLPNDDASKEAHRALLRGLKERCGDELATVDGSTFNPSRVWRLYGTLARKGTETPDRPYRRSRVLEGSRPAPDTGVCNLEAMRRMLDCWRREDERRHGRPRDTLSEREIALQRAKLYLAKEEPAISGQHGHDRTFHICSVAVEAFGLCEEDAYAALQEWNSRCVEPWQEKDLRRKIREAIKKSDPNKRGHLLGPSPTASVNGSAAPGRNGVPPGPPDPAGLATRCLADAKPQPVHWLIEGYLPLGKLVMLAGDGGHGKSTVTLDIASSLSTGRPCLGLLYPPLPACEVLLISCEDDIADTVSVRLRAAGADMRRVFHVEGVKTKEGRLAPFNLAHYELLEKELADRPGVRLVVVDPAGAFIGQKIDDHKDSELRGLLGPLSELAAKRRVTILIVKHFNKGATAKAVHRVGGSVGYVNSMRAAFIAVPDKDDNDKKLLLPLKFNIGPKPSGLAYQLSGLSDDEKVAFLGEHASHLNPADQEKLAAQLFRVHWLGTVDRDADSALQENQQRGRMSTKQSRDLALACDWLKNYLAERPRESLRCIEDGNKQLDLAGDLKFWRDRVLREGLAGKPQKIGFRPSAWFFFLPHHPRPFPGLKYPEEPPPPGPPPDLFAGSGHERITGKGDAYEEKR